MEVDPKQQQQQQRNKRKEVKKYVNKCLQRMTKFISALCSLWPIICQVMCVTDWCDVVCKKKLNSHKQLRCNFKQYKKKLLTKKNKKKI